MTHPQSSHARVVEAAQQQDMRRQAQVQRQVEAINRLLKELAETQGALYAAEELFREILHDRAGERLAPGMFARIKHFLDVGVAQGSYGNAADGSSVTAANLPDPGVPDDDAPSSYGGNPRP